MEAAKANLPSTEEVFSEENFKEEVKAGAITDGGTGPNGKIYPTEEEYQTLRRVIGKIDWVLYTIAFVELCERFAYYGTTAVCEYGQKQATAMAL